MTARIFLRAMSGIVAVLVVALAAVDFLASRVAERTYLDTLKREMFEKARTLAALPPDIVLAQFQQLGRTTGARLTLIATDGTVIRDSEADAGHMENHRHRPELEAALSGKEASSIRPSPTLGVDFLYLAVPVRAGALRVAVPLSKVTEQVDVLRRQLLASTAVAFIPAMVVALLVARSVSARLAKIIQYAGKLADGHFDVRLPSRGADELGILSTKLNETGEKLARMFHQLEREHAELEKLERIRKDFVINVSHELRTPLASIHGYAETLLEGAIDDPNNNVRFVRIIRQNAERLTRLTADLLTLSRVELGTKRFQFAGYYLNRLLSEHVDTMLPIARGKNITLRLEPADPNLEVFCDAEAAHQIITNLIDNAIKYTPEGGRVTVGANAEGGDRVEIWVEDTGIGIPAEELPRLFERFYRVDKARSRELGGTGLGLAIVKHLVRAQGGEVRVASEVNRGSRFAFTLPVHDIGQPETAAFEEAAESSTSL